MSRDVDPKPPIWARPEPRSRGNRGVLSRAEIVQTALKIADEEGLAEVSIRRIARELRSGAMSLYHYFDSRDELLDACKEVELAAQQARLELTPCWGEQDTAFVQSALPIGRGLRRARTLGGT